MKALLLAMVTILVAASAFGFAWDPSAGADGYRLYRAPGGCAPSSVFKVVATFGKVTTGADPDVLASGSYCYTVTAFNTAGESGKATAITVAFTGYDDSALKSAIAQLDGRVKAVEAVAAATASTLDALDNRVDALEQPAPTSAIRTKPLSDTQIEVSCANGTRPSNVLNGNSRILTCTK